MTRFRLRLRSLRALSRLLFWGQGSTVPTRSDPAAAASILARTEELNRNAERHWRAVAADHAARAQVLGKPFWGVDETGPLLCRLGIVLTELELGIGHKVLDFAAGSCWLSLLLNRLGCHTVALDVSPTALALGREMFGGEKHRRLDVEAAFEAFDGHRFPAASSSVDRVVCFDGFHHVPNPDEVLGEMFRVLREGGRAVFAEPGEGHSHAEDSLVESGRFGILEGDIHLPELIQRAKAAGFTGITVKPYPDPAAVSLSERDYLRFMAGALSIFPVDQVRENLRQFSIVVLRKGPDRYDSRKPHVLRASLVVEGGSSVEGRGGQEVALAVTAANTGDTAWRHEAQACGGYVRLGAHLATNEGSLLALDHGRAWLERDVPPGGCTTIRIHLPLPRQVGRYRFVLDLVVESVGWFERFGNTPVSVEVAVTEPADSRTPSVLRADLHTDEPLPLRAATPTTFRLTVTNTGDTTWLAATEDGVGAVAVGGHLAKDGVVVRRDVLRAPLSNDVEPGGTVTVTCPVPALPGDGGHTLVLDLLAEGIRWFAEDGSRPIEVPLSTA